MSSIKATKIDGDVSVGRNVSAGGRMTVQGHSRFKGNVKVHGWLDAKNIKGMGKGLFQSEERLNDVYPNPIDGWWALVGKSIPADVYEVIEGKWVATGEVGGDSSLDNDHYEQELEELYKLIDNLEEHLRTFGERDVFLTEQEYEALKEKDDDKMYYIYESE